jgi:hypothetical protein
MCPLWLWKHGDSGESNPCLANMISHRIREAAILILYKLYKLFRLVSVEPMPVLYKRLVHARCSLASASLARGKRSDSSSRRNEHRELHNVQRHNELHDVSKIQQTRDKLMIMHDV